MNVRQMLRDVLVAVNEHGHSEDQIDKAEAAYRAHDAAKAKPEAEEMSREPTMLADVLRLAWAGERIMVVPWRSVHPDERDAWRRVENRAIELFGAAEAEQRKQAEAAESRVQEERALYDEERRHREGYQAQLTTVRDESHRRGEEINRLSRDLAAIVQIPRQYGYEQAAGEQPADFVRRVLADMHGDIEQSKADLAQQGKEWAADNASKREEIERLKVELVEKTHPGANRKSLEALCVLLNELQRPETYAGQDIASGAVAVIKAMSAEIRRLQERPQAAESNVPPAPPQQPDGDDLAKLLREMCRNLSRTANERDWLEVSEDGRDTWRSRATRLIAVLAAHKAQPNPSDAASVKVGDWVAVNVAGMWGIEYVIDVTSEAFATKAHTRKLVDIGKTWRPATDAEIRAGRALT